MAELTAEISVKEIIEATEFMALLAEARGQADRLYAENQKLHAEIAAMRKALDLR